MKAYFIYTTIINGFTFLFFFFGCHFETRVFSPKEKEDTDGCLYFTNPFFRLASIALAIVEIVLISTFLAADKDPMLNEIDSFNQSFVGCFDYGSAVYFDAYEAE